MVSHRKLVAEFLHFEKISVTSPEGLIQNLHILIKQSRDSRVPTKPNLQWTNVIIILQAANFFQGKKGIWNHNTSLKFEHVEAAILKEITVKTHQD